MAALEGLLGGRENKEGACCLERRLSSLSTCFITFSVSFTRACTATQACIGTLTTRVSQASANIAVSAEHCNEPFAPDCICADCSASETSHRTDRVLLLEQQQPFQAAMPWLQGLSHALAKNVLSLVEHFSPPRSSGHATEDHKEEMTHAPTWPQMD